MALVEAGLRRRPRSLVTVLMLALVGTSLSCVLFGTSAIGQRQGPGACGYSWTDSKSPPPSVAFTWIEIKDNGSRIGDNDWIGNSNNGYKNVSLGFSMVFYDQTYSTVFIGTNGYVSFGQGYSDYILPGIPNSSAPNNAAYLFGQDLAPGQASGQGGVYYLRLTTPNRFITEFYQVPHPGGEDLVTFEAIFNETGEIWFQYLVVAGRVGPVGIENADGTGALAYGTLSNGLAIRFSSSNKSSGPVGVSLSPCAQAGLGVPGHTVDVHVRATNTGKSNDTFEMTYFSLAGWPGVLYESDGATPLADTNGDGIQDTGSLGPGRSADVIARVTIPLNATKSETVTITGTSTADPGISDTSGMFFAIATAFLRPPHSDFGVDLNQNGLFDSFVVNVSIQVVTGGTFLIYAELHDPTYTLDLYNLIIMDLPSGPGTVPISFEGWLIHGIGKDGPYFVELRLVEGFTGRALDHATHMSQPYSHSDFERVPAILSTKAITTPAIDGNLSEGEWSEAAVVGLTGPLQALLYVKNSATMLYIAYDAVGDFTHHTTDAASVSFDTGNDMVASNGHEDQFVQGGLAPNDQGHWVFDRLHGWTLQDSPFNDNLPGEAGLAGARGFGTSPKSGTDHRMYEFAIPIALLDARPGDTLGFWGGSQIAPGVYDAQGIISWSFWPEWRINMDPAPLYAYGDLVLAGDTTPPTIALTSPGRGAVLTNNTVEVDWTASDFGFGLDHFEFQVDGGPPVTLAASVSSRTLTSLADGSHTITVTAFDVVGQSTSDTLSLIIDTVAPTASILTPAEGAMLNDGSVTVTWNSSDAASGVDHFEIALDNGAATSLPAGEGSFMFDAVADGAHTVRLTVYDKAGFETTLLRTFTVDTTPPVLRLTWQPPPLTNSANVTLSWYASDSGTGLDRIEILVDAGVPRVLPPATRTTTLPGISDGPHTFQVMAFDRVGLSSSIAITTLVDTMAPIVRMQSPEQSAFLPSSNIVVSWTSSDTTSGIDYFLLSVDGGATHKLTATTTNFTFTELADGLHVIWFNANDRAGNVRTETVAVIVDTTDPSVSILSPGPAAVATVSDLTVIWSASDATSGINHVAVAIDGNPPQNLPATATSLVLRDLMDGTHIVTVTVVDRAGNFGTTSVTFRIDTSIQGSSGLEGSLGIAAVAIAIATTLLAVSFGAVRLRRRSQRRDKQSTDNRKRPP